MAEDAQAEQETTTWDDDGAGGAPTAVVPPETVAAPRLAWSLDEPDTIQAQHESWRFAWNRAAALLLIGAVVAVVIAVVGLVISRGSDERASPPAQISAGMLSPLPPPASPAAPETTTVVAAAPPMTVTAAPAETLQRPPPAASLDPLTPTDHSFLAQLDLDGIPPHNRPDSAQVAAAEAVCRMLNAGSNFATVQSLLTGTIASPDGSRVDPPFTPHQATAYIQDAVIFYCPHALR